MFKCFSRGLLESNSYVVYDKPCGEAMIIDCGNSLAEIGNFVKEKSLNIKYIVLTHSHFDHAHYIDKYREFFTDAKVCAHKDEAPLMCDSEANVSILFGSAESYGTPDLLLSEGDVLKIGELSYKVLSTPGHTPGSICLFSADEKLMFTGDTLFMYGRGRCDFKYGSEEDMARSLSRLLAMDGDILFCSGHGMQSYIRNERGRIF